MKKLFIFLGLVIVWFLGGCAVLPKNPMLDNQSQPTPTYSSFFNYSSVNLPSPNIGQSAMSTPTIASFFTQHAVATLLPLSTPSPATDVPATDVPAIAQSQIVTDTVFDDRLNSNWSMQTSPGMEADQANTTHARSGNVSIAMTPQADFSKLSFVVNQNTTTIYKRDQVIGISFWLNSGNDYVKSSDLGVSVMGSNSTPYWVANDNSALTDKIISFSETRLYYMGLNRSIPPETWVHLILYLDNQIYDPPYKYLTGFYIKNDAGFLHTVYIDDVGILMVSNNSQSSPTFSPTGTATPIPANTPEPTPFIPITTPQIPGIQPN